MLCTSLLHPLTVRTFTPMQTLHTRTYVPSHHPLKHHPLDPPQTAQLFLLRWNTTYPNYPWVDSDTVQHRWVEVARDKTTTLKSGLVKRMGLTALHGTWVDVVAADGTPITVTRLGGTGNVDAGAYADELKALVDKGAMKGPCRLVERSVADGSNLVVGKAGNGLSFDKKSKLFRNFQPVTPPGADQPGLVLQVADGVVRPLGKIDNTMERKLLSVELGIESFDVSLAYAVLMDDGHKLLGERSDFVEVRAALDALKNDRNELVGHEGCVSSAEYKKAVANIHTFLEACVDKYALFDATWKQHLEDAVANACMASWTVNDLEIVCRTAKDYVDRSRREAKTLFYEQVNGTPYLTLILYRSCAPWHYAGCKPLCTLLGTVFCRATL
jgi:hypothetical protein